MNVLVSATQRFCGLAENNIKGAFYTGALLDPLYPIYIYMMEIKRDNFM